MNDRYLFRGKTKIGERWVIGDLLQWGDGDMQIVVNDDDGEKSKYTVIPETVGQCTGRKDKKVKPIFEGDIAKFKRYADSRIGKILFNHKTAGFEFWWNVTVGAYGEKATYTANLSVCDEIEVIGNIHDNPELLEVKE